MLERLARERRDELEPVTGRQRPLFLAAAVYHDTRTEAGPVDEHAAVTHIGGATGAKGHVEPSARQRRTGEFAAGARLEDHLTVGGLGDIRAAARARAEVRIRRITECRAGHGDAGC